MEHRIGKKIGEYRDFFRPNGPIAQSIIVSLFGEKISLGVNNATEKDFEEIIPGIEKEETENVIMIETKEECLVVKLCQLVKTKGKISGVLKNKRVFAINLNDLSVWNSEY